MVSKVDDYGVRVFNNEMVDEIVFIDKTGLEDAITFQNIDYEIVDGYYFDEGRNDKINEIIQHLFNTRKQKKKEKNPIQKIIKLIMNSIYGKTILKPIDTQLKIVPKWQFASFALRHYHFIKEAIKVGYEYYVKLIKLYYSLRTHFQKQVLQMAQHILEKISPYAGFSCETFPKLQTRITQNLATCNF